MGALDWDSKGILAREMFSLIAIKLLECGHCRRLCVSTFLNSLPETWSGSQLFLRSYPALRALSLLGRREKKSLTVPSEGLKQLPSLEDRESRHVYLPYYKKGSFFLSLKNLFDSLNRFLIF